MRKKTFKIVILLTYAICSLYIFGCSNNKNNPADGGDDDKTTLTGKFVFVSRDDGDAEIYTMNADGTDLLKLTNNTADDVQPVWSPDGSKIAYYSWGYQVPSEIYVMNSDGSNVIPVTHDTQDHSVEEDWPSWSPDGTKILYESYVDAENEPNGTTIINANIYFANSSGSGDAARITNHLFFDGDPCWSPDGSKVAFVHAQVDTISDNLYSTGYQVWMMNTNGSNWIKLSPTGSNNNHPRWSPDGTKIVYQSDEGICIVKTDGTYQNLDVFGNNPSWSPDGTKIIFDGSNEIYIMNSDGSDVKTIPTDVGARQVDWTE